MTHKVPPEYRASRSFALALPYAGLLGLPKKAIAGVSNSSRRVLRKCRDSMSAISKPDIRYLKTRHLLSQNPNSIRASVQCAETAQEQPETDYSRIEAAATIEERARCARIVRRGIELGVAPFAAALAFDRASLDSNAAIALVERLASLNHNRLTR